MNIIDELSWRGLINQSTDLEALREEASTPITLYCGFDPTGPSLHAGHLVPLLMLRRFQQAGHNPIVLAGGATGMIGDPRDVGERTMNSADTVSDWAERISGQLSRFVDFDGEHAARLVNNAEWTNEMSVVTFLRDVGKHFSLNTMLARDTVKRRLESDGISYTEFSYMLLQANDYVELNKRFGCTLQVGGGDQWGNIVSGVDLNRRVNGTSVHAVTVPLVTDSDGKKFGKSTGGGSLWLDPEMTSPYAWYQYFINASDADVIRYLRWFTFLTQEELAELEVEVAERPFKREAQRRLAREMTNLVHGTEATEAVELAAQALFGRAELRDLDEKTLAASVSETAVAEIKAGEPRTIIDLLVASGLADSKGAAKRAVKEGGAYVNNERIESDDWEPFAEDLLHGSWLVLRRGKKNFAGVQILG
ncbi:tyrosyl-tRNA synthetase [Corynebacterium glutamicum MB001]|uniref:Tyrosine--tRNA ligase n=1 Tax=Corynebacterium glutamicum (strain ATCC 13032 / DSM 20300 / JCM 1318 / BCRC 11384 / CCUG 27702 / LMG 3730 / NBRC 12168 / NCIMB 10025 / NRRL B-2784 / 534) TaxID=196627 RepID=SYY_CORGL|nr:tyrosine--tRNA ligase [Corynebacterium glutamicum]Q8NQM8.1 RecName: Full=Tyrosine--tRNA ligase; AltName: Full=Tyrosyl-tRNA synthetase; Short=TyrRS [Corynebacterium glutamicum ATCC 13032]AGT05374.1 tyrosyl-tRNA synthetase [Corynebacterium glutamicum MB001]ARV64449.1 tyrosine--tRNA ligase [Corynebacterium glutamicum]ASW14024.1 tyrosyl-tRNA synthetase [Corynebacterium glutamicum]AUI00929.1 tyrosine--tRNA ligase [Corynebacterium glutamicum]AUI04573.1 tyrosine--tRNA ligase [Corynebacterium glut